MTIRIYALAKELNVESKVLTELCQQLGIKNKAGALANLNDEDVEKIKNHLAQQSQKTVVDFSAPANNAPIPPSHPMEYGKIRDLTPKTKSRPKQEESDKNKDLKPKADSESTAEQPVVQAEPIPESTPQPDVSSEKGEPVSSSQAEVKSEKADAEPKSEAEKAPSADESQKPAAPVKPAGPKTPVIKVIKRAGESVSDSSEPKSDLTSESKSETTPEAPSTQAVEPVVAEKPVTEEKPVQAENEPDSGDKPGESDQQTEPAQPIRKRSIPVINVIGHREERKKPADSEKKGKEERRRGPLQRLLAPMPEVKQPSQKKEKEPAAQKPEIRLSTEVIRNVKAGKAPLEKHLKQAENQRQEELNAAAEKKKNKQKKNNNKNEIQDEPQIKGKEKTSKRGGTLVMMNRDQRQQKRKDRGMGKSALPPGRKGGRQSEYEEAPNRPKHLVRTGQNTAAPRKNKIVITLPITVRSFAEELELPVTKVITKLMQMGMPLAINASMDADTAELVAAELNFNVEIRQPQSLEEKLITAAEEMEDAPEDLKSRPPIITFLGHVDHGKTSLLDRIIGIDVCSGEKGGITQHIRAYQISKDGNKITFVDTPGHQAFTEMRARGANCTDIAVLVVAADDGVMPQTEEAISHARAAGVPIVVALNKIDIPGVNIPKVLQELASHDVLPSEWGGDVEVVKCSAMTGEGVDELLDTILTVAELHDYKANPKRAAMGICLESQLNQDQGAVAKMLVQKGTLKVGDIVVCGSAYGRVKSMTETLQTKNRVQKALPSMPVNLFGLDKAPGAGDKFYVLDDITEAREIAARKAEFEHQLDMAGTAVKHVTLEDLFGSSVQTLNVILRTDVRGSIEAIKAEIAKLENPEVQIKILQAMVGGITEADVALADASNAIIFGFNVVPDENARVLAEQKGVQIRRYDIIYKMTDDIKAAMEGMLKPEEKETELGRIVVQKRFVISHVGTIAGCRVLTGMVQRGCRVRLIRENRIIGDYSIETLKREKDDVKEVQQGYECGIKLQNFNDIKEGDVFEAYKIEEVSRKL
ncbi:MAG: translation initiation factor IF-2 [Thermoguttaceae bacterium]|nr:translation initiation factor IF-2 [Thermoguttaceae bacterium]